MNTDGLLKSHSKKKLQIYKEYLSAYLNVMSLSQYKSLEIIDLFAGMGITKDNGEGSAIIAAKEIKKFIHNPQFADKKFKLIVNEPANKHFTKLKENLREYDFVEYSKVTANEYLHNYKQNPSTHSFFLADQFGYKDVDFRLLSHMLQQYNCEFLVFLTVTHIFRFITSDFNKSKSPIETIDLFSQNLEPEKPMVEYANEKQNPSLGFLKDLGIGEDTAKLYRSSDELANAITSAIKIKSNQNLVNCRKFRTDDRRNLYCLYYITKSKQGMHKFIEAFNKVEKMSAELPLDLPINLEEDITNFLLKQNGNANNVEFCDYSLISGLTSKEVGKCLKSLEASSKIFVESIGKEVRNNKGFYISYNKNIKPKINIKLRERYGTVND